MAKARKAFLVRKEWEVGQVFPGQGGLGRQRAALAGSAKSSPEKIAWFPLCGSGPGCKGEVGGDTMSCNATGGGVRLQLSPAHLHLGAHPPVPRRLGGGSSTLTAASLPLL